MSAASARIGAPLERVDGVAKVTGAATYAAEHFPEHVCHAVIVESTLPRGRILAVDREAAERMPGVVAVMAFDNAPELPEKGRGAVNPPAGREKSLLQDNEVRYNGEPIAVVVAESLEQATDAAARVRFTFAREEARTRFEEEKATAVAPRRSRDKSWGDVAASLAQAEVRVDATYVTPMEHHNPIEPHATVAWWEGESLTVCDSTQYVVGVRDVLARTFGVPEERVTVISPYVGGGFGSKGSVWSHVVLCAMAARVAGRPVKLALTRHQLYGPVGGRPCTEQRVMLAARSDGRLVALEHHTLSHTSAFEDYVEGASTPSQALYRCPNGSTTQRLVRLDLPTPTFMRAPGEVTGTFAIESAMDELAWAIGLDPVELRLRNHADVEPASGKPWSSKMLRECYAEAAERFGWRRRSPAPGSMREGPWRIGWGMATATYPGHYEKARACATLMPDGTFVVRSATQDIGTGTYTIMTQVAAQALGVPVARVRFELGDSRFPHAPISGGSMTAASVGPAVHDACLALRRKLLQHARGDERLALEPRAEAVEAWGEAGMAQEEERPFAFRSFGAVFVEVRVDPDLGVVRVPRVVGAYAVGRVLNARTARSQVEGGIVGGIGMALMEESILDLRTGRFVNSDLAEYHVPVNADVGEIDVTFVEEEDGRFNPLGARGIGEIGITGVAGAIANAVFHATGRRVRRLPISPDRLV